MRSWQKSARAQDVDGQATLGTLNHSRLNRTLFVMRLFHFVPGVNAGCLLVREVDVAFLGVTLLAHHINFVARLHLRLAFVIQHFRQRQHAFRLGAHVYDNVGRRQLEHRAFDHAVFSHGLLGLRGEAFKR